MILSPISQNRIKEDRDILGVSLQGKRKRRKTISTGHEQEDTSLIPDLFVLSLLSFQVKHEGRERGRFLSSYQIHYKEWTGGAWGISSLEFLSSISGLFMTMYTVLTVQ